MSRLTGVTVAAAVGLGVGCSLLTPYPGGEDPAEVLSGSVGDGTFDVGELQEPLVDPAIDDTIGIITNQTLVIAIPGEAFPVDLEFSAENRNVVGGGIQFPGSDEVQWTFIPQLDGEERGNIRFGFVVDSAICQDIPNLCHELVTKQFAVARNTLGDVDGDGEEDGDFVVSPPEEVTVVLVCSTCESPSCQDVLPEGDCQQCTQPSDCVAYEESCLDVEMFPDDVSQEDVDAFRAIFGPDGALWTTLDGCALGTGLCSQALDEFNTEMSCRLGGGEGSED